MQAPISPKPEGTLVLTRRKGQGLIIHGLVEIVVQSVRGNTTILSIRAPKEIEILRTEVAAKRLNQENSEN